MKPWNHFDTGVLINTSICIAAFSVCLWLLRRLGSLEMRHLRQRLFVIQLYHLALADAFTTLCMVFCWAVAYVGPNSKFEPRPISPIVSFIGALGVSFAVAVSCIIEFHISVGFLCGYFGYVRSFPVLRCSIWLAWPFGFLLSFSGTIWMYLYKSNHVDLMNMIFGLVLVASSALCYAIVSFSVYLRKAPASVQHRVWLKAWFYPVTFFFTTGPVIITQLLGDLDRLGVFPHGYVQFWWSHINEGKPVDLPWLDFLAWSLLALNGPINIFFYVRASGYLRRSRSIAPADRAAVQNLPQDIIRRREQRDQERSPRQVQLGSFHVQFASSAPETIPVSATTLAALSRAEAETEDIERARYMEEAAQQMANEQDKVQEHQDDEYLTFGGDFYFSPEDDQALLESAGNGPMQRQFSPW